MAVLHDYICAAHGKFDSFDGRCPHGCDKSIVQKVFLKPPGMKSDRTKHADKTLNQLALDFNLTDMNNRGGDPVAKPDPAAIARTEEFRKMFEPQWGALDWRKGADGKPANTAAISQALAEHHAKPDNALVQVKDGLVGPKPNVVNSWGSASDIKPASA